MNHITITDADHGKRLDKFLVEVMPDHTRSQIQKKIKAGGVTINNENTSVHHFLKTGDIIAFVEISMPQPEKAKKNIFQRMLTKKFKLTIVHDDPTFLVVDKPSGLLVHEAPDHSEQTLVDLILPKYPAIKKIGEDPMRPGIVHRLDREVSGLVVIAKTQDMFDHLKSQFKTRQVNKQYYALVYGHPDKDEGEIRFNIDRSTTTDYKMAAVPEQETERGRKAITEFKVIERLPAHTLLNALPHTGRTHQIRVHLNAYGLPIVGDLVYKPKKLKKLVPMGRVFLQAYHLAFTDLNGKQQQFEIPMDSVLQKTLNSLKKT